MKLFNLSHPIEAGLPVYPGDPQVAITPTSTLASDGANVSQLQLGSHTGTHLDAPAHVIEGGKTVDQLQLELLCGPAVILHPPGVTDRGLQPDDVAPLPTRLPTIVCIATGWDRYFQTDLREAHPYVTLALAERLWDSGARVLGMDILSPDPAASQTLPVHELWLGRDGIIVENLRGLTQLPDRVQMSLLPLNLRGVDGSPIRAVAWENPT